MASTYLTRTISTASNRRTWTWSAWVKRSDVATGYQTLFSSDVDSNNMTRILFWDSQQLTVSSKIGGSFPIDYRLTRTFRDTSAWYHIVVAMDTTQTTDTNRLKIYINGVLETAYEGSSASLPSLDEDTWINSTNPQIVGKSQTYNGLFNGSMSHIHFIDGTAYDASAFGSTDATTGEWEAKTSPSVTYGTNGFFILKDGNGITDQSGEGNDFTLGGGTLTDLKDNPENTFATLNSIDNYYQVDTLSNGNLTMTGGGQYAPRTSTIALNTGKYYWETKVSDWQSSNGSAIGVSSEVATAANYEYYNQSGTNQGYGYFSNGSVYGGATLASGYGTAAGTHYIGVALDLDNNKIAWSYDGAWQGSANPSTGANMLAIAAPSTLATGFYFAAFTQKDETKTFNVNFGNGYFGTTAITTNSGNGYAGAEGASKFNYTVPTGYSALNTKGLNE